MLYRDIIDNLHNFVTYMKYREINTSRKEASEQYHNIKYQLEKIISSEPQLIARSTTYQVGGEILSADKIKVVNNITELFTYFQKLNPDDLKLKGAEIDKRLDEILALISDIKKMDIRDPQTVVNPDRLIQYIDTMRVSIEDFTRGIKVYPQRVAVHVPIDVNPSGVTEIKESVIAVLEKELLQEIENHKKSIAANSTHDASNFTEIVDRVNKQLIQLDDEIEKLKAANTSLEEEDKRFRDLLRIEISRADIAIVPAIDALDASITTSGTDAMFVSSMKRAHADLRAKHIKQKDYVDMYNNLIGHLSDKKGLPDQYFDGRYTKRITNNILLNDFDVNTKLTTIKDMLVLENSELDYNDGVNLDAIYEPDFKTMKRVKQTGGTITDAEAKIVELDTKMKKYIKLRSLYHKNVKIYNRITTNNLSHTLFLLLIVTNQLFTSGYIVYKYINKGLIEFYRRIIDDIYKKIDGRNTSDEILYLRKYHLVTILKLKNFLDTLSPLLDPFDVVDIEKCASKVANVFLLLNYFKDILGSFNEMFQNKITIYSRINDIRHNFDPIARTDEFKTKKMFISDYERKLFYDKRRDLTTDGPSYDLTNVNVDPRIMWIRSESCSRLTSEAKLTQVKFTEVFDTVNFPLNGDISKYMTLDTQLSKGKGVSVITYGYSGTGKTYTLFGNRNDNKEGVLQATLDNISGLKYVKFRLYEIYGLGLPYPNYWKDESTGKGRLTNIYNNVYNYNLALNSDGLGFTSVTKYTPDKIRKFVTDTDAATTYLNIQGDIASDIFRNFDSFISKVEDYREGRDQFGAPRTDGEPRRIRDTPNNIVSSRSVLIYDFMLGLNGVDKDVPFLIIDLPGREEIIQTYVKPYIENPVILNAIHSQITMGFDEYVSELKLFLASMTLNPLAITVFNPTIMLNVINSKSIKTQMWDIFDTDINLTFDVEDDFNRSGYHIEHKDGKKVTGINSSDGSRGFKLDEEFINAKGATLTLFFDFDRVRKTFTLKDRKGFGYSRTLDTQYLSLLCIHIMNRLIIMNRFDIIEKIYAQLVDVMINSHLNKYVDSLSESEIVTFVDQLKDNNFKGELLSRLVKPYTASMVKQAISYDYYLTGFEGVYINENIIGLIKFLAERMITDEKERDEFLNQRISKQRSDLNFQYQQKVARVWLISKLSSDVSIENFYRFKSSERVPNNILNEDLSFDKAKMDEEFDVLADNYKSDKIFNFDNPLITDILEPYLTKIDDYKVFYLFGNYGDDIMRELKCSHQFSLFKNTENFIQTITE